MSQQWTVTLIGYGRWENTMSVLHELFSCAFCFVRFFPFFAIRKQRAEHEIFAHFLSVWLFIWWCCMCPCGTDVKRDIHIIRMIRTPKLKSQPRRLRGWTTWERNGMGSATNWMITIHNAHTLADHRANNSISLMENAGKRAPLVRLRTENRVAERTTAAAAATKKRTPST